MGHGSAIVEKIIDGRRHVIRVKVAVERPTCAEGSYIRYGKEITETAVSAGAWSGARFARHKVDRDRFGIEIQQITGDVDTPDAACGAAVATAVATWIAYEVDWNETELIDTYGWSLPRPCIDGENP